MQVSLNWINEFVKIDDLDVEEIAQKLTISGLEVEEIEKTGPKFENITIAKILNIANHPNADKLHLVTVETVSGLKTVVCGAQNIKVGQFIPYASIGSKVLAKKSREIFALEPVKIRGIESEGMLCADYELGLENFNYQEEDGILILNRFVSPEKLVVGKRLEEVLEIETDNILHTAPTANRADEMSIIGIAREIAALFSRSFNFAYMQPFETDKKTNFKVEVLDPRACSFYSVAVLKNIKNIPSPAWMQKRLISSGMRPINLTVDVTNYVMLEYGQPLHAFDYDKLNKYLCVKFAKNGDQLITLDDELRKLNENTVVCADENGLPVCIGGVFGGKNSAIDENTKNIVLEAADFNSASNRKSARSVGYRSDASARFERGVDPSHVKSALYRAVDLMTKLSGCDFEGVAQSCDCKEQEIELVLRFAEIKRILGIEIDPEKVCEILSSLGFSILGKNQNALKVKVPSFRFRDVYREIDLIEEVARIYGFDNIASNLPCISSSVSVCKQDDILKKVENMFLGQGFSESVSSSLIGEKFVNDFLCPLVENEKVSVKNAQSDEFCTLRQSLVPNMLKNLENNVKSGNKNVWLYEIGKIYFKKFNPDEKNSGVFENLVISFVMSESNSRNLWQKPTEPDFFRAKGVVENLMQILGLSERVRFKPVEEGLKFLHPGKSANVFLLGKNLSCVGFVGQVHPNLEKKFKFPENTYIAQLDIETLLNNCNLKEPKFKKLPQFPSTWRDIAFIAKKERSCEDFEKIIQKACDKNIFKSVEIFDIYESEKIKEAFKSFAFRVSFQNPLATLTDNEVDNEIEKIKNDLKKHFPEIELRES